MLNSNNSVCDGALAKQLHYQRVGSGYPLLLLHGLFGQSDNLMGIAKALSASFDVIVPDMLNHGRSYHHHEMNYPLMVKTVTQLLDCLNIDQCHVVGHSMGGKVAMQLASMKPCRVNGLVVVDIAPVDYPLSHHSLIAIMQNIARMNAEAQQNQSNMLSRREAKLLLAESVQDEAVQQFLLKNYKKDNHGCWQWQFSLNAIHSNYKELAKAPNLDAPFIKDTLFIKGGQSDYIRPEHQSVIELFFPAVSFKIIQGAGHWLHSEKPQAFLRVVERFLMLK